MQYSKLQIGCMLIVLYVTFMYVRERHAYKVRKREPIFEALLIFAISELMFDGLTAYTVNHVDRIPPMLNQILHLCFLCSIDTIMFLVFLYILDITKGMPKKTEQKLLLISPWIINILVVIIFSSKLEYRHGMITNYSMGVSAYTCYVMFAIYILGILIIFFTNARSFEKHKLIAITTYIVVIIAVAVFQIAQPQALITALVPTFAVIGTYMNLENPLFTKLREYNNEMVMGFATLVENRDGSTGGHIKRTTEYVRMLAEELKKQKFYKNELTNDYIKNLVMAAPMHDVGKIAIPDAILQKPGRLTKEEFDVMKTHAERGGKIIQETFKNMGQDEYREMAYLVARHHHEKWNGKGYPDGLSNAEIPLCARIMAVADVFDAVSAKRCYRDAMPLEECFKIIEDGSGQDFDPVIANVFLGMKQKITAVYEKGNM